MQGMSAAAGTPLEGIAHLRQSIRDILTTRVGSRVMRRRYGSVLPNLVDRPMTPALEIDIYAGTAEALDEWEPRVRLERVEITDAQPGVITLALQLLYLPDGQEITLDGVIVQ